MSNSPIFSRSAFVGISGLLSRLEGVRQRGGDRWSALCPGHDDKSPSLSIRELPDGRVLLHCYAGCDTENVLASIGLTFDALFPEKTTFQAPIKTRRLLTASHALELLERESLIVLLVASDVCSKKDVSSTDVERVRDAYGRIAAIREEATK